ncbi:MAG: peptidylprolyl isomerase [Candidatus Eisenbacteria bacterium]|uniref:Peptidylprolyl isomerase n=1 Tax=Eiseniibacteriota bacterium TaxID=2212470 RepID=A0A938BN24_UNCEI|nr:peptidylprolyl isomerase [Candidatus Eisenbacteria bacterium]
MISARRALVCSILGLCAVLAPGCGGEKGGRLASDLNVTDLEVTGRPEAVVARVDGRTIALGEVDAIARAWAGAAAQQGGPVDSRRVMQSRAMESMIDQLVLAREAERRRISVPDSLVDQMVASWERQFPTPEMRQQRLAESQMTMETMREKMRTDALVQRFVQEVVQDTLQVRDDELQAYYDGHPDQFRTEEQVHARHILVKSEPTSPPAERAAAREKAEGLRLRLLKGGDFAAIARENSDCPSASGGGDLGFFSRRQMVPPFSEAAFALQPGQMSGVVETQFGFHLIKVEERRPGGVMELAPIAERLRSFLMRQELQEAVDRLAQELRGKSKVETAF